MIEFGQVQTIIWIGKEAYLLVKLFETLCQDNSSHAYNLREENESKFIAVNVSELMDCHPLDGCMPFEDHKLYVKLKYAIVNLGGQLDKHLHTIFEKYVIKYPPK
jgi:hypothetical protein